ncbi:MAG TPA: hypothetical protein VFQ41_19605 [Candidatus Angelobacter sp.]|nr:hypothetical protein [Candidatus Angelobacter sp.]
MKISVTRTLAAIALGVFCAAALAQPVRTVTLVPPMDPVTKKYDEGKSCFNFKLGLLKETVLRETKRNDWDLGYGSLSINEEDWFTLHFAARSVIEDLGERDWNHPGTVPVLEPLPPFPKDKPRVITIDSSADTHQKWAKATHNMAKIRLGHMYALHVKNDIDDFYVMLRVDELEQKKRCTISWRLIPSPQPAPAP